MSNLRGRMGDLINYITPSALYPTGAPFVADLWSISIGTDAQFQFNVWTGKYYKLTSGPFTGSHDVSKPFREVVVAFQAPSLTQAMIDHYAP